MAAFIAKQMMGNQLSAVKDIGGGESMSAEEKERLAQLEQERLEALKEQEEQRRLKHMAIEEERERMRSGIRDKYNIRKKQSDPGDGLRTALNSGMNDQFRQGDEYAMNDEQQDDFTTHTMAAFIAKQMVGNQLSAVKDMGGGGDTMTPEEKEKMEQLERERLEALREAEERRIEKHRKMEEEREGMRQGIRDKYGIKKREEKEAELKKKQEEKMGLAMGGADAGGINRKKKTPEEIAAEQEAANQDEFTKLKNTIETQVNDIKAQVEEKCSIQ